MSDPVVVRILPRKISAGELGGAMLVTVVPVAVVILMQKPELRQSLQMRAWHYWMHLSEFMSGFWQHQSLNASTEYNKARMLWGFSRMCGRLCLISQP